MHSAAIAAAEGISSSAICRAPTPVSARRPGRSLRELRTVLHQGLTGQAAAAGINALLDETVPELVVVSAP